jgi:hypothetical protein|nr:MAG TPA: hypothetical protein [Caudoviricetes sp.]
MARVKAGYKSVSVVIPEEIAKALDEAHWTLRREVPEILTEIVTKGVEEIKASTGK